MTDLKSVYESYWNELEGSITKYKSSCQSVLPTNPLLINIDEEKFRDANLRIMFFGQETNDWEGAWGSRNFEQLLGMYKDFFVTGYCFKYGGHFWNGVSDYLHSIGQQFPNKSVSFVWNNIIKIGRAEGKGTPPLDLIQLEKRNFPVIQKEIEILQPNIIIFFTGPNYDNFITMTFGPLTFEQTNGWNERQLARVTSNVLPKASIRTYHPRYLWQNNYKGFKESILGLLSNQPTIV